MTSSIARSGLRIAVDAVGDDLQRVDVEAGVGLVENRQRRLQHRHLEDLVALLLAARESFVHRAVHQALVHVEPLHALADERHELHRVELLLAAVLAQRVQRRLEEVGVVHARNLDRVLKRHEHALARARLWIHRQQVLPFVANRAGRHLVSGWPASTRASVLLPEPFGPMIACTWPASIERLMPRRISRPPPRTCRFSTLRSGLANAALQRDAQQLLRLDREFHRQLPEHLPQKPLTIRLTASSVDMPRCRQ